jgi:hypothetical protein
VKSDPSWVRKGLKLIKAKLSDKYGELYILDALLFLAEIVKYDPSSAGKGLEIIITLPSDCNMWGVKD